METDNLNILDFEEMNLVFNNLTKKQKTSLVNDVFRDFDSERESILEKLELNSEFKYSQLNCEERGLIASSIKDWIRKRRILEKREKYRKIRKELAIKHKGEKCCWTCSHNTYPPRHNTHYCRYCFNKELWNPRENS